MVLPRRFRDTSATARPGRALVAVLAVLAALASLVAPGPASAQDDAARARDLFDRARAAFDARRFPEARELLEESLTLAPRAPTALNLARVRRSMGELLAAEQTLQSMLSGEYGRLAGARRADVESLLDDVRREVAVVSIRVSGTTRATVAVDGVEAGVVEPGNRLDVRVNPASHVVSVQVPDGGRARAAVSLGPGEHREISLVPAGEPTEPVQDDDSDGGGVVSSPWFWIAAVLVVAGGVTATAVLVSGDHTADPVTDPVFPIAEALRF